MIVTAVLNTIRGNACVNGSSERPHRLQWVWAPSHIVVTTVTAASHHSSLNLHHLLPHARPAPAILLPAAASGIAYGAFC